MPIRVLDTHTAELIAAGEVVERPASVVKELVENAIDAGAAALTVEIERGGIASIRVQDDGCGIPKDEVPLAFLRHATSKVQHQRDLDAIVTLGFRGEALASIASVARVEVLTRAGGEENASRYLIEGGAELANQEAARQRGTTFSIQDIFYNTPARMKFLKKDASEGAYVTETVVRLALSHPEVGVKYLREGKEVFATPGDGQLEAAIYAVLGREFVKGLLVVENARPPYALHGFITKPREGRGSRSMQYFFINGRFVKNRTMMAALEQAYRGSAMQGRFPGGVLFLTMPPQLVDVNVHPAKTEVRFANESEVFAAVYRAVKEALAAGEAQHNTLQLAALGQGKAGAAGKAVPASAMVEEAKPTLFLTGAAFLHPKEAPAPPAHRQGAATGGGAAATLRSAPQGIHRGRLETLASEGDYIPYQTQMPPRPGAPLKTGHAGEWGLDILPEEEAGPVPPPVQKEEKHPHETPPEEELRFVGEVFTTYILAQLEETLYVIDKHAAHERILYEKLAAVRKNAGAQQLLVPVAVHLSAKEKEVLLENLDLLAESGMELEDFGAGGVMVRAVPADVHHADVEGLVADVARGFATGGRTVNDEKTQWVLHSMACRAAVKGGDKTQPEELLHLAGQIVAGTVPPFCPHGRPVVLEITRKELEKQFGRLG